MNDLAIPFVFNRTIDAWRLHGSYDGDLFKFEFNDDIKQVLIRGDKIDAAYLKWTLERPRFGPRHNMYPGLTDENKLFIGPNYTVFAEFRGQFFRVDRSDGDVVLVLLDPKNE